MIKKFNSEKLNTIIYELLEAMDNSKNKASKFHKVIFDKINSIEIALEKVNDKISYVDAEIKKTSAEAKEYRDKLLRITKSMINNPEIQQSTYAETYKIADELVVKMSNLESEYKILFKNRDKLERELLNVKEILIDAEDLIQSINTSFRYLKDDLSGVSKHLNEKEAILLKIIDSGENEKKAIARDIHDGPAQTLAYLNIEIQLLKELINANNTSNVVEKIEEIDMYIKETLEEMRQIIHDLRPMSIDDLGLIPTIKNYIKEFNKKLIVLFELSDDDNLASKMPGALSVVIFRIIQESLNNIYKHAEATIAIVNIQLFSNIIKIEVLDNGKGFDVNETFRNIKTNGSFGLLGMKERVDLIGGEMNIQSNISGGTKITVSFPWDFSD